jgi:hypothetical protein
LVWNALAKIGSRMHQWSSDGGDTWTAPRRFNPKTGGGYTGQPGMAFDSAGHLHVITSVDGPRSIERLMHFVWDRVAWGEPEVVSAGTDATDSVEWPSLALAQGNRLYAGYEGDFTSIWVSEHRAAAPPIAPRPLPAIPTDVATRWADASLPLRLVAMLLALLLLQYMAELGWRRWRRVGR